MQTTWINPGGIITRIGLICQLLASFIAASSWATVINVPGQYDTIQEGINASTDGDTVLVAPGTYSENLIFNGHSCVLTSRFLINGDTSIIGETVIDGNLSGSVISLQNSETGSAAIIGFTIRNGHASGGGGIFCSGTAPLIKNNIITGNTLLGDGSFGGGVLCHGTSSAVINSNWITYNRAGYGGGIAIYNSSPLITDNFIYGNATTWSEVGGSGGGIYCTGASSPTIAGNEIRYDSAFWGGGGIACSISGQMIIEGNIISDNFGGGIAMASNYSVIRNNVISRNTGIDASGGIACYDFGGEISHNVISHNISSVGGAGLYCYSSLLAPTVTNNIIYANGKGIFFHGTGLEVVNTILWGNDVYEIRFDSASSGTLNYSDIQGGWPGHGNIDADPLFRDTTSGDFRLMSAACGDPFDSPCIDTGDPAIFDSLLECLWGLGTLRSDMGAYGGGDTLSLGVDNWIPIFPENISLLQNYPNPFNSSTTITFELSHPYPVRLEIFDLLGRKMATLEDGERLAGRHQTVWHAGAISSGIYLFRLVSGERHEIKRMMLLR